MKRIPDPLQQYQEIFQNYFQNISKLLDKKQKQMVSELFDSHKKEIQQEQYKIGLSANKHFILFYKLLKIKNYKISFECLYQIEKLIQNKYLSGNCSDYITNAGDDFSFDIQSVKAISEKNQKKQINTTLGQNQKNQKERKLYNCIIDIICEQIYFKDEAINIKIIQCLQHLMTSSSCEIHGDAVIQVIKTLIEIHKQFQQGKNQGLARNAALQIIHVMYMRMEQVTILNEEDRRVYRNKKSTPNNWINPANNNNANNQNQNNNSQLDMNIMLQSLETSTMLFRYYVKKVVGHCIDDVCLYDAKKKEIMDQANHQFPNENQAEEKQHYIQNELNLLPIRSAPLLEDSKKPEYQQIKTVQIKNEQGIESGKFGWCFICRNTAKNYCKDTRVPICSESCKLQHIEEISRLEKISEDRQSYLQDGILVFQYLSQAALLETQNPNNLQIKETHLILEMLLSIFESGGPVFMSKKEFINVIKNYLVQSLLQNCLNSEKSIFVLSFSLVVDLVTNFRENLKKEVAVFVQDIFLNILDSNNSNFNHRMFTISAFHKIFKVPRTILELFVNYDCALGDIGLVENIITMLTRVGQGKYLKQEYSTLILPQQEFLLKKNSIEAMKELVKRLCEFSDQCEQNANEDFEFENENFLENKDSSNNLTANSMDIQIDQNFDRIEKEKNKKQTILKAIQKFNLKAKNGISYLIQQQIIDKDDYKQLALIFYQYKNFLNQEIFGQFLGNESEFNQSVLSEFIDLLDFRNLYVDQAMRDLLTHFQLPGEAQQVDRILQKFGEKYINDNAGQTYIKNGNVAYVFSYSLMMLQTSLHNPQVQEKDRMTQDQFRNLIRGINEEDGVKDDIDPEEVGRMYREIESKPLALHKEKVREDKRDQALNLNEKQKKNLFLQECINIVQQSQSKIDSQTGSQIAGIQQGQYVQVFSLDYIKSLMKEIWSPLFVSFSQNFEESDDKALLESCLEGIVYCIKLLGISGLTTEKETFLYVLTKYSGLNQEGQHISEKNIMSIRSILKCALTAGNYLFQSWKTILKCVSQIEYYQVQGSKTKLSSQLNARRQTIQKEQLIEQQNSEAIVANIETGQIDKIFHLSHHLSPEQIKIFIRCLCQLSKEELNIEENPRIFCMQRISEVTGFNMKRVKYNWQEIWSDLSQFFYEAGTHINPQIQELSVDFLKQLALKFLEQKELKHFTFQKDFLAPFEQIYLNMKINNDQLKELIISCIYMLTNQSFYNLMSGWKIILRIVNLAIQDNQPNLVQVSFMIIKKIMNERLENVLDVFVELVQALTSLSKSNHEIYAVQSILYLKRCLDFLITNSKKQIKELPQLTQEHLTQIERTNSSNLPKSEGITDLQLFQQQQQQQQQHTQDKLLKQECQRNLDTLQLPVMSGMAKLFDREGKDVQKKSLEILFQIIQENCQDYNLEFWKQVFKNVLKPLFEEICIFFSKKQFSSQEQYYKTEKATIYAFERFQELILSHFDTVSDLFQEIIDIVQYCAKNQMKNLVHLSTNWLISVLEQIGQKLSEKQWQIIINMIQNIQVSEIFQTEKLIKTDSLLEKPFDDIVELIPKKQKLSFNIDINFTINQTMNQFLIIVMAKKIFTLFSDKFTKQQIESVLQIGEQTYNKAKQFNDKFYLRYALWKFGLMVDLEIVPGLYVHEKESFSLILETLNQLSKINNYKGEYFETLVNQVIEYLENYKYLIEDFLNRCKQRNEEKSRRKSIDLEQQQQQKQEELEKQNVLQNTFQQSAQHSQQDLKQMYILGQKQRLTYMKQVLQSNLLPNLKNFPLQNLKSENIQKIMNALIDISNHSFNQSLAGITCKHCNQCENCSFSNQYSYNEQIKEIMKKIFEFSFQGYQKLQNLKQNQNNEQKQIIQSLENDKKQNKENQHKEQNKNDNNQFIQIYQDDFIESRNSSYEIIQPELENEDIQKLEQKKQENDQQQKSETIQGQDEQKQSLQTQENEQIQQNIIQEQEQIQNHVQQQEKQDQIVQKQQKNNEEEEEIEKQTLDNKVQEKDQDTQNNNEEIQEQTEQINQKQEDELKSEDKAEPNLKEEETSQEKNLTNQDKLDEHELQQVQEQEKKSQLNTDNEEKKENKQEKNNDVEQQQQNKDKDEKASEQKDNQEQDQENEKEETENQEKEQEQENQNTDKKKKKKNKKRK
ncbi:Sec7 domain [Pseudocohnilembus persalinus]|uniref:Sec7 domain n=1 Tax=Pseudocohnilembus persalinus TaxID=266149 RepID=A0A0V0R8Y1_PSEPJ|nr:Sec7 domain [Pseudocohnilembus persalinus]|eukprot:KRX10951.1 Sec7 domain [Pseudocohnilembus persalinus]